MYNVMYPSLQCHTGRLNHPKNMKYSRSGMSGSLQPYGLCPWDFPGKSTGVGCHFILQRIFPTQGSNPGLIVSRRFTIWATRRKKKKKRMTLPFPLEVIYPSILYESHPSYHIFNDVSSPGRFFVFFNIPYSEPTVCLVHSNQMLAI